MPLSKQSDEIFVMQNEVSELSSLKKVLTLYSCNSLFEDDEWLMDKALENQRVTKGAKTIYFRNIPLQHKYMIKVFALIRLSESISVGSISNDIYGISKFFTYLLDDLNDYSLSNVNKKVIFGYKDYLDNQSLSIRTKESIWTSISNLYKILSGFNGLGKMEFGVNPYSVSPSKRKSSKKYIEEETLKKLDLVFYDEKIPLVYRTAYWVCRLIPSRITEISSMRIGSIKPYLNERIITIPSFKQNGGHKEPETRQIAVKDEGMGRFLLNLIKEQEDASMALQKHLKEENKGYLFTHFTSQYVPTKDIYIELKDCLSKIAILNGATFNRNLNAYCKRYHVTDVNGEIASITSHIFRHHGITDRIYAGFRIIDIMSMTNHKSSKMITDTYIHIQEDELRKNTEKILKKNKPAETFRGKIFDTDNTEKESRIMSRPFAHKVGRLGLCSDISNCPSEMFECFSCHNFVPNINELDYFMEQLVQWEEKAEKFADHPFMKENADYNISLNKAIIDKINNMVKEGDDVEKE